MQLENIKSFLHVSNKCKVAYSGMECNAVTLHYVIIILATYPTASCMDSLYKMQLCY